MEWRSVSCLWRLRLRTSVGLLWQFECRSHQAHRCMFPHFRPPVTLSTASWFCCRSRCRPVSSWCRVSLLSLELRRPSPRTQSSPLKLPSPPLRLFQLVTKASYHLYTTQDTHWWLCIFTQGPKLCIFMIKHKSRWHLTTSLSDYTENCLLPAILESKPMSVPVYSPCQYFTKIHTTEGFNKKNSVNFMCLSTFYSFIVLLTFYLILSTQNYFWSMTGVGVGVFICGHGHRAQKWRTVGQKWRTVGQNVTYAGLKSDVRAKMQHWSVIITS